MNNILLIESLVNKIDTTTKPGCWLFTGGCTAKGCGYGVAWDGTKATLAHRLSYEIFRGPIPEGACVLHKCSGTPNCCNPSCLYLGNAKQNAADRKADPRGWRPGKRKKALTTAQVRVVFARLDSGETAYQIAQSGIASGPDKRSITEPHISYLKKNRTRIEEKIAKAELKAAAKGLKQKKAKVLPFLQAAAEHLSEAIEDLKNVA